LRRCGKKNGFTRKLWSTQTKRHPHLRHAQSSAYLVLPLIPYFLPVSAWRAEGPATLGHKKRGREPVERLLGHELTAKCGRLA
jgi:hypothetical protein